MKLDEITALWDKDSIIDTTELGAESSKIPQLQARYIKIFFAERMQLKKLQLEMHALYLLKHQFYADGPTEETEAKGWIYPTKGIILKNNLEMYMLADPQIQALQYKIDYQKEKTELLSDILNTIKFRSNQIKNHIDWHKFTNGQ